MYLRTIMYLIEIYTDMYFAERFNYYDSGTSIHSDPMESEQRHEHHLLILDRLSYHLDECRTTVFRERENIPFLAEHHSEYIDDFEELIEAYKDLIEFTRQKFCLAYRDFLTEVPKLEHQPHAMVVNCIQFSEHKSKEESSCTQMKNRAIDRLVEYYRIWYPKIVLRTQPSQRSPS